MKNAICKITAAIFSVTFLITLLTMSVSTFAQSSAYIGFGLGQSTIKLNDNPKYAVVSQDNQDTAYKIVGGYGFTPHWGIEGGYIDFGKLSNRYDEIVGAGMLPIQGRHVLLEGKAQALYVAGIGTLPLGKGFSFFGKVGVASTHATGTVSDYRYSDRRESASKTVTTALIGIGGKYQFTDHWGLVLEYEDYGKIVKEGAKINVLSLSMRYSF